MVVQCNQGKEIKYRKRKEAAKMTNYFESVQSIDELKKEYKRLARKNHPDVGGDTEVMKEINRQYEEAFNV